MLMSVGFHQNNKKRCIPANNIDVIMTRYFGKKFNLINPSDVHKIPDWDTNTCLPIKIHPYFQKVSQILKKKVFHECMVCRDFFFSWENFYSFAQENFHHREHPSRMRTAKFFPRFSYDWCDEEEIILAKGILNFGFSNWNIISILIATKTPLECENHFYRIFGEFGVKKHSKNWRIRCFGLFHDNTLKKWQDFLPMCNLKIEKKGGWLPLRCEFVTEYEENFEELINEYHKSLRNNNLTGRIDQNYMFLNYNRQIYYREIMRLIESFGLNVVQKSNDDFPFDDSLQILCENFNRKKSEYETTWFFKFGTKTIKKNKRLLFFYWISHFNFISKIIFCRVCSFWFLRRTDTKKLSLSYVDFFISLFRIQRFKQSVNQKIFFKNSMISTREKSLCLFLGIDSYQFILIKTGIIFSRFFFIRTNFISNLKLNAAIRIFFVLYEYLHLNYKKKIDNIFKTKNTV